MMYRIFIVEDDMTIAGVLAEHLGRWDYEAACAKDFRRILEEFVAFDPQLVLLDIVLPFLTGFTGARRSGRFPGFRLCFYPQRQII